MLNKDELIREETTMQSLGSLDHPLRILDLKHWLR